MNYSVKELFILFMIYSFIGWVIEMIDRSIIDKKIVNRGFLIGPYCPIYGCGAILMILLLQRYIKEPITLFFMSMVIFSILEYTTSYVMEKLFKARWWDYSNTRFNLNGRICLETMIPFGFAGMIAMYIVNPFFVRCLQRTPDIILTIAFVTLSIILIIDLSLSTSIMANVTKTIKKVKKDNTEEITKKVKDLVMQKNYFKKRIIKAFPKFKIK
ncbi:MAG: putative ABC transporter permease [Bacilli bacterium]|nr:putative ABC transporter permease [Bacilli bacterium]